ncbi:MAG TPA: PAS domain-containing sensor histidine kinase [Candidatus Angelobacter sp.]|nr:PAS domain-containing sensor histidine kinase [Candidatus Angelobacter sp.]
MTTDATPDADSQHRSAIDLPLLRGEVAFRLLVDAVADYAIFLLGPDGRVLTWNLGAQRIKGYTAEEIIGQHFSRFYTPADQEADRPSFLLARATEYGRFEDEGWRMRRDGTRFWADVVITALRETPDAPPYAFVKITRDLTERRAAEEQQRELVAEQRARVAAEEALAARDRFLGIASHELKTPVASLRLATEAILRARDQGRLDDLRLEANLRRILTASTRLGELLDELLDVNRLTAADQGHRVGRADLTALVREVVDRFADHGREGRIRLSGADQVWIELDAARIDQVVTNLVDNALKYSGGDEPIEVEVIDAGDRVGVRVADRGIGLDEATKDRIFEAFGRGENAEHYQGIGLGLYISQQIVARHGGRIDAVARHDGPGSVFTMDLPRREVAE